MTQQNVRAVIDSLPSSERELLLLVGRELLKDEHFAAPLNDEDIIERAQRWLNIRMNTFREVICGNKQVKRYIDEDDTFSLIVQVADLITAYVHGIPLFTVAKLVVARGIKNLCNDR